MTPKRMLMAALRPSRPAFTAGTTGTVEWRIKGPLEVTEMPVGKCFVR